MNALPAPSVRRQIQAWAQRALCALLLASPLAAAQDAPTALRVTYLVYSGRPNPTLTITDAATVRSLHTQLADALATGAGVPSTELPPVLGYNGIRVEAVGAAPGAQDYTVKGRFLRAESRADAAKAGAASVTARASTSAAQVEAQLLKLAEQQGVLNAAVLAAARRAQGK